MSDDIKINRPAAASQPAVMSHENSSSSKTPWIVLAVIVIVLVVVGVLFRDKLFNGSQSASTTKTNSSAYQAVFLTNGQVYFGKLSNVDGNYATMTDIYYLQVVQPPLQGTPQSGQAAAATTQAQPQISLVKLGQELHGPVDEMHIARTQILFYEDLKSDGNVVKAIESYKANPSGTPAK